MATQFKHFITENNSKIAIIKISTEGDTVLCDDKSGYNHGGFWYFLVNAGLHTVKATLGSVTTSKTINVTSDGIYYESIDFKRYLYKNGDECTDFTGGFAYAWYYQDNGQYVRYSDHIYCNQGDYDDAQVSQNIISFDGFTKICFEATGTSVYANSVTVTSGQYSSSQRPREESATITNGYAEISLSKLLSGYHLGFSGQKANIYKVWLE